MKRKLHVLALTGILGLGVGLYTACVPPQWFQTAISIAEAAVPIAGSIIDILDPALAPVVTVVENAFSALINALNTYKAQPTDTNLQVVEAALTALQQNEAQLEAAAQIHNSKLDAIINGVLQLISTAAREIAALVPPPIAAKANLKIAGPPKGLTGNKLKADFNKIVGDDPRFSGKKFKLGIHRLF